MDVSTGSDILGALIARASSAARRVPARAHLRPARHEGYAFDRAELKIIAGGLLSERCGGGTLAVFDDAPASRMAGSAVFESAAATGFDRDDYLAFCRMMLTRELTGASASVRPREVMTTDQLTPERRPRPAIFFATTRGGDSRRRYDRRDEPVIGSRTLRLGRRLRNSAYSTPPRDMSAS